MASIAWRLLYLERKIRRKASLISFTLSGGKFVRSKPTRLIPRISAGLPSAIMNGALVPDMTVGQKISAIAHSRFAFTRCAPVCRYEFAKRVFIADFQISR